MTGQGPSSSPHPTLISHQQISLTNPSFPQTGVLRTSDFKPSATPGLAPYTLCTQYNYQLTV